MNKYSKIIKIIKKEAVLIAAAILAVISSFIVHPSKAYAGYIDYRTLIILWSLMAVVGAIKRTGAFDAFSDYITSKVSDTRTLSAVLVASCFFFSMLMTNDVALITFVPLTLILFKNSKNEKNLIKIIVFQTVAANLGSMLTPVGNPQNLYLFTKSGMSIGEFLKITFPYVAVSFVMLMALIFSFKPEKIDMAKTNGKTSAKTELKMGKMWICFILFALCALAVLKIADYRIIFLIVLITILFIDRKTLILVDYSLILTFVAFFIFVGNVKNIEAIQTFFNSIITGNEKIVSIISSQVISNVPAAVLMSGFTSNYKSLIAGTNIGGLGTIIASMASLISYKFYVSEKNAKPGGFMKYFTIVNIGFLVVLYTMSVILDRAF